MNEPLRVAGAVHDSEERTTMLRRVLAEQYAERLLDALADLVQGRPQARMRAMRLLAAIDAGTFPNPRQKG